MVNQNIIRLGFGWVVPMTVVISTPLEVCLTVTFLYGLPPTASSNILDTMYRVALESASVMARWYNASVFRCRCRVFSWTPSRLAMSRLVRPVAAAFTRNSFNGITPLRKTLPCWIVLVFFLADILRPVGDSD